MKENRLIYITAGQKIRNKNAAKAGYGPSTPTVTSPTLPKPLKSNKNSTMDGWASEDAYNAAVARGDSRATNSNIVDPKTGDVIKNMVPTSSGLQYGVNQNGITINKTSTGRETITDSKGKTWSMTSTYGQHLLKKYNTPPKPPKVETEKDRAKALMGDQYNVDEIGKYVKDTYGIDLSAGGAPTDIKSYLDMFVESQKEAKKYQEKQNQLASQVESSQYGTALRQSNAAVAGTQAALAQGREGVTSLGAPMVAQQFKSDAQRAMAERYASLQASRLQRDETMRILQEAQAEGNYNMALKLKGELATQEANIQSLNNQTMQLETQRTPVVMDTLEKMGSAIANVSVSELSGMIAGTSITLPQVLTLQKAIALEGQAKETKNLAEAEKLQAEADMLRKEADMGLYGTAEMKNVQYFNSLSEEGKSAYREYLALNEGSTLTKYTDADGIEHILAYNPINGESTEIQTNNTNLDGGSQGTVEDAFAIPDGTKLERGECGEFVNDYSGAGMPDLYTDKLAKCNPNVKTPQPGDVFVMPTKEKWGHTGFILNVSADGNTVTVKDSNWDGDNKVKTHDIPASSITGLIRPAEKKGTDTKLYSYWYEEGKRQGMNNKDAKDFAKTQVKESFKDMTESESKSFDSYGVMENEEKFYDELYSKMNDDDVEDFADSIDYITKEVEEDDFMSDIVNDIENDTVRQAITSEMRWIEGALRKASGAAITVGEYKKYGRMYFPREGDDIKTIQQKEKARDVKLRGAYSGMGASGQRQYLEIMNDIGEEEVADNPWDSVDTVSGEDVLNEFN